METAVINFLESNRETLKNHGSALVFFGWAQCAVDQGADLESVFNRVFEYNVDGI